MLKTETIQMMKIIVTMIQLRLRLVKNLGKYQTYGVVILLLY